MKRDILILGGTGFIGAPLVRALRAAGPSLAVFHRGHKGGDLPDDVARILGDRRDLDASAEALRAVEPRVVVDVIAYTEAEAAACARIFEGHCERFVVLSSQDVYRAYDRFRGVEDEPADDTPITEDAPLRRRHFPYRGEARTGQPWIDDYEKILVERAFADRGSTTVLRLPMVYGPGDRQHRTIPYLKRMDDGRDTICLEADRIGWRTTRGFVDDVARAIAAACLDERAAGRVYNVGEAEPLTEEAWIRAIGEAADWRGRIVAIPGDLWPTRWKTPYRWKQPLIADTAKLRDELGVDDAVDRADGLRRTIAWERTQSPALPPMEEDYATEDALIARWEAGR